ncbi:MAG: MATE family efflux transporter [Muribaculaceae bacterium]|nr:MATE family efflux transporter [Muribaculaceae bacterium]
MISPIHRNILALAIPSIIANITTPLMGLVDTVVTGHLGNEIFIASIAVAGSLFNLLYWPMGFLRMGTSGLTAQAFGRSDQREQADSLYRGLVCSLATALLILLLQRPLLNLLLDFISGSPETDRYVRGYFEIVVWGAPAVLSTMAMSGWLVGMHSAKKQMVVSIIINVVNIAISPLLAFYFEMGIRGVACGTLIAQWTGALVGIIFCIRMVHVRIERNTFSAGSIMRYFRINSDIFFRTLCLIAVTLWFTREGARQGELMLSVNALLMQFFVLFSYMTDGFAYAAEAEVGRLTGAGSADSLRYCVRLLMRWGFVLAAVFSLTYFLLGGTFLELLTDQAGVVAAAKDYLPWACTVPLTGFMAFTWDGVFIGATMTRQMLVTMIISMGVFFAVFFLATGCMGNHGLWVAFTLYLLTRGLMQWTLWYRRNNA